MHELPPAGDELLAEAALVIPATVDLADGRQAVWDALGSDRMWSWFPGIDKLRWTTDRGEGGIRELRIARAVTVREQFYRWEEPTRATFRVTHASRRAINGLVEDFQLEELPGGGTRLTWTMAVDPRGPRPPRALGKLLATGNRRLIAGIRKILTAP